MKSCLVLNCLKFRHIITIQPRLRTNKYLAKNDIRGSCLIACCKQRIYIAAYIFSAVNSLQLQPDKCDVINTSSAAMNI